MPNRKEEIKLKFFTVTVPCYNSAAYMAKCIDSLLVGGDMMDIVIINDGSVDDTGKIADYYAAKYPDIVQVVHQENGGHGEGINQGIKHAKGKYFMVVDSDDWLEEKALKTVLEEMQALEKQDGVDMLVTNYVYAHDDEKTNNVISYKKEFRKGKATCWQETKPFALNTYLTLHSIIFRTQILRDCKICLPKHTFYEDNYFAYYPLKWVERFKYIDVNLYYYYIGREGQSVQSDILAKRYAQQIAVSLAVYKAFDVYEEIAINKKRGKYMYHNCLMVMSIATAVARLNGSPEAEKALTDMWEECIKHNKRLGKKMRYLTPIALQAMPGKPGRRLANLLYKIVRKIVKN